MNLFFASVQRDLLVHFRHPSEVLNPLVFFIVVISLFPLGIGPEPGQLKEIAPGIVWVAALLATLMSMDSMFRSDFEDGSLEQVVLSEQSTFTFVLAKVVSHWLLSGLPLVLLMPLAALLLFLDEAGAWALTLSLLLVSPTLSLLGGIGAALTVGLPRGGSAGDNPGDAILRAGSGVGDGNGSGRRSWQRHHRLCLLATGDFVWLVCAWRRSQLQPP